MIKKGAEYNGVLPYQLTKDLLVHVMDFHEK